MAWETDRKVQLAVPVSQLFLAWPGAPEARPVGMSAPVKQAQGVEGFHA